MHQESGMHKPGEDPAGSANILPTLPVPPDSELYGDGSMKIDTTTGASTDYVPHLSEVDKSLVLFSHPNQPSIIEETPDAAIDSIEGLHALAETTFTSEATAYNLEHEASLFLPDYSSDQYVDQDEAYTSGEQDEDQDVESSELADTSDEEETVGHGESVYSDSEGATSDDGDQDSYDEHHDYDVVGHQQAVRRGVALKPEVYMKKNSSKTKLNKSISDGKGKPKRKPCKDAREFWTRWNADNKDKGLKRKSTHLDNPKPAKQSKSEDSAGLEAMGPISATTKAGQVAQFKAHMPQGGDTRRTKSQMADHTQASKSFGLGRCIAVDEGSLLKHTMKSPLKPFQLPVVAWMCRREVCADPAGGLLADDMGIGKTVSTLACISEHGPSDEDVEEYGRATLVVVPNRIVAEQWQREIKTHCRSSISDSVAIYNRKSLPITVCRTLHIVITTYSEVSRQWPSKERVEFLTEKYKKDPMAFTLAIDKEMGPIFEGKWYRVVLDEAHHIKNRNSQASIACSQFNAKYRWCLSGTPLSNHAEELFPYLRFLRCCFTQHKWDFNRKYVNGVRSFYAKVHVAANDPQLEAAENFEALVSLIMYRRTQEDDFFGHKIIDLPDSTYTDIWVPLCAEEEIIARCILEHFAESDSKSSDEKDTDSLQDAIAVENSDNAKAGKEVSKEDGPEKGVAGPITMAAVSHPFNLEKLIRTKLTDDGLSDLIKELAEKGGQRSVAQHLLDATNTSHEIGRYKVGIQELGRLEGEVFGGLFNMQKLFKLVLDEARLETAICTKCGEAAAQPRMSLQCEHIYCLTCIQEKFWSWQHFKYKPSCDKINCDKEIILPATQAKDFVRPIPTMTSVVAEAYADRAYRELGDDVLGTKLCSKSDKNGFFTLAMRDPHIDMAPGAKLTMTMSVILQWQAEHPEDKILVFTQFIMTGKILGSMLQEAGIKFLYYYGECGDAARNQAIEELSENPDVKVMLMGLRAGGTALNLTAANRVILIDPWWNDTVEKQAFGRVKRIGQKKETHLVRILCNTVDDIISKLQLRKSAKIGYALQDDGHTPVVINEDRMQKLFMDPVLAKKSLKGKKKYDMADKGDSKKRGPPIARARGGTASKKPSPEHAGKQNMQKATKKHGMKRK